MCLHLVSKYGYNPKKYLKMARKVVGESFENVLVQAWKQSNKSKQAEIVRLSPNKLFG